MKSHGMIGDDYATELGLQLAPSQLQLLLSEEVAISNTGTADDVGRNVHLCVWNVTLICHCLNVQ